MKLLIYLFVFVLLFNGFTANKVADSLIRKSCMQVLDPYYYEFCIPSLKENPESQKVKNIDELIVVGANGAMSNLTNVKRLVEKIIKERKYKSRLSKKLLEDCVKLYSEGYHSLTSALEYFKARDFVKAEIGFNKAKDGPILCELGFNKDNQQLSPVSKENDVLFRMIDIPVMLNGFAHTDHIP